MAETPKRVAAGLAAGFFLVASVATSAAVIYTLVTKKDKPASSDSSTSTQASNNVQQDPNSQVGKTLAGFTPVPSVDKLVITDTKVGDGAEAKEGSKVTAIYVGALANNGTIFDASPSGQPATFGLNQVIEGWQKGVPGMKVGGTRRLLIPAAQAYGAQSPSSAIPANSNLVFDITLVAVQ